MNINLHNPAPFQFKNSSVLTDELTAKWPITSQPMTMAELLSQPVSSGPSDVVCVSQKLRSLKTIKFMSVFSCGEKCNCNKYKVPGVVLISLHHTSQISDEISCIFMQKKTWKSLHKHYVITVALGHCYISRCSHFVTTNTRQLLFALSNELQTLSPQNLTAT